MPFFDRIAGLEREQKSFAIATVVARRSPVSSHLGDRALIFADGHMEGFVGGSCSRDIVRRHGLGAIHSRRPVLLQIRPDSVSGTGAANDSDATSNTERVIVPMSCSSEGAVDVYIEPRVPLRHLVVIGFTPVAEALAQIGVALDYDVVRVVVESELRDIGLTSNARARPSPPSPRDSMVRSASDAGGASSAASRGFDSPDGLAHVDASSGVRVVELKALRGFLAALDEHVQRNLVAIVASQGHYDELALEILLERPIAFAGLLASRRRAATVLGVLTQQGVPAGRLATIHNPVGLDIGARSPGEVAVSILAQIIAHEPNASETPAPHSAAPTVLDAALGAIEIDPVCGMDVETVNALYRFEHTGNTYFFCGANCRAAFSADPEHYLLQLGNP